MVGASFEIDQSLSWRTDLRVDVLDPLASVVERIGPFVDGVVAEVQRSPQLRDKGLRPLRPVEFLDARRIAFFRYALPPVAIFRNGLHFRR